MQVELFKKKGTYENENGELRNYTNFYVKCGDELVPVSVTFFKNKDGEDPLYRPRKMVLSAFAGKLPKRNANAVQVQGDEEGNPFDEDGEEDPI